MEIDPESRLTSSAQDRAIAMEVIAGLKPLLKELDGKMDTLLAKLDIILGSLHKVGVDPEGEVPRVAASSRLTPRTRPPTRADARTRARG